MLHSFEKHVCAHSVAPSLMPGNQNLATGINFFLLCHSRSFYDARNVSGGTYRKLFKSFKSFNQQEPASLKSLNPTNRSSQRNAPAGSAHAHTTDPNLMPCVELFVGSIVVPKIAGAKFEPPLRSIDQKGETQICPFSDVLRGLMGKVI